MCFVVTSDLILILRILSLFLYSRIWFGCQQLGLHSVGCNAIKFCLKLEIDQDSEGGVATCLIARSFSTVAERYRLLGGYAASIWRNISKDLNIRDATCTRRDTFGLNKGRFLLRGKGVKIFFILLEI